MIFTPASTRSSATLCAAVAGTASTPTMMFLSRTASRRSAYSCTSTPADSSPASVARGGVVCNTPAIVPGRSWACAGPSGGRTLCVQFPDKRRRVEVVDEGSLAVDLDDRQPLAVALLELGHAADV